MRLQVNLNFQVIVPALLDVHFNLNVVADNKVTTSVSSIYRVRLPS